LLDKKTTRNEAWLDFGDTTPKGFRLSKLELWNWGTFDSQNGQIYSIEPDGETMLLVGENGSGKSTLVDAILTLLVEPGNKRNYNVAAGAKKNERNERTYIKGAFRKSISEESTETKFLRPKGTYSVLLAIFENQQTEQAITVAQFLYVNSANGVEKVYCFDKQARSISADFSNIEKVDGVSKRLAKAGFKTTKVFREYQEWFTKATGLRRKAMDIFNQTVAVKDINNLNDFIRNHMLEKQPWGDRVDQLLAHFSELTTAHQTLLETRRQLGLLEPVVEVGQKFRKQNEGLGRIQRLLANSEYYFLQKHLELFPPARKMKLAELQEQEDKSKNLASDIKSNQEQQRKLKNDIEYAGGDRLKEIPQLIEIQQNQLQLKQSELSRYEAALKQSKLSSPVKGKKGFKDLQHRLAGLETDFSKSINELQNKRDGLIGERAQLSVDRDKDQQELDALSSRTGNLPENMAFVRRQLCDHLGIPESELPFACELMSVPVSHRIWQSSVEKVLRGFGLNLLVPEKHFRVVSRYVDKNKLTNKQNHGTRLTYRNVGERLEIEGGNRIRERDFVGNSILEKLEFKPKHRLIPWLKAEVKRKFNFDCCETIEDFERASSPAMTPNRHLKRSSTFLEKDDRRDLTDPKRFVLGWDNKQKKAALSSAIAETQKRIDSLSQQVEKLDQQIHDSQTKLSGIAILKQFRNFDTIDVSLHQGLIAKLAQEKRELEEGDDQIKSLKKQLDKLSATEAKLSEQRDATIGNISGIKEQIKEVEALIGRSKTRLKELPNKTPLGEDVELEIESYFESGKLAADTVVATQTGVEARWRKEKESIESKLRPIQQKLTDIMHQFLRKSKVETGLRPDPNYLDDFLARHRRIVRDDLPKHAERFKKRLNDKVTREISFLHGQFKSDCAEIESKIDLLNESLKQVDYGKGTFMRLEPRQVKDKDVTTFRQSLHECLAGSFEGTDEADEARFEKIKELLIDPLSQEGTWRDKVTDVRRWFDFAALELERKSLEQIDSYRDGSGKSGGEKAKLAFTILVSAIAYQYGLDPECPISDQFHFAVVDEMFSKVDDKYSLFALDLFKKFDLQLLIVSPLDAKAKITEDYTNYYAMVAKNPETSVSKVFSIEACPADGLAARTGDSTDGQTMIATKRPR